MLPVVMGAAVGAALLGAAALRYRAKVNGPFEPTHWVWSRGLALLCDKNGGVDFVKRQRGGRGPIRFDPARYSPVHDGELVWVRHIALPQFVREVLPGIRRPFALVTGDEDWSIPSGYPDARRILENEHVVRWFTQNDDGSDTSGKVLPIPIGLDFHTISNGRKWGHWPATPREQEADLRALCAGTAATRDRKIRVHADFHFNKHKKQLVGDSRAEVEAILRRNASVDFLTRKIRRRELWQHEAGYAFVASPHGNGLDCHRTWEALVLGCIPIVRKSSLDPLYDGLPVVIVDRWEEIGQENLERWLAQHADAFARADVQQRLTARYWIDHMRKRLAAAMGR